MSGGLDFMECDTCRQKPGSHSLCRGCLHNRIVIERLERALQRAWADAASKDSKRDIDNPLVRAFINDAALFYASTDWYWDMSPPRLAPWLHVRGKWSLRGTELPALGWGGR